ncbi:MAG: DoxX family protein [Breznakibacter sp.]
MMKIVRTIFLVIVGLVFVFSGFVKAVDPIGGAIKFTDYFNVLGLGFLNPLALFFSIALAAFEFLLGIHLVMRLKVNVVMWAVLVLSSFFLVLTLYIALFEPVTDCGCFGDAIKMTNWQTFYKNLVLMPMVVYLFVQRKKIISPLACWKQWVLSGIYAAMVVGVSWYSILYEPLIDFRPYKVGTNIPRAMSVPQGAVQPEYDTRFILEKDGIRKEFGVSDYPYTDSTWVFIDSRTVLLKEGYQPPIQHFTLNNLAGEDLTQTILNDARPVFLLVVPKVEKIADPDAMKVMSALHILSIEKGFGFYCATSSLQPQIQEFDMKLKVGLDYLTADETVLKTISRSKMGLLLLQQGTIAGKWNAASIANAHVFDVPLAGAVELLHHTRTSLGVGLFVALLVIVPLLFFKKINR